MMWLGLMALAMAGPNDSLLNAPDGPQLVLNAELGFTAPISHTIQFGQDGDEINYITEGGQDNLFPFARFQAEAIFGKRHTVTLLYQPLVLTTDVVFSEDKRVDGVLFEAGTPMDLRYGFSFWRGSYTYDLAKSDDIETGIGLSLQIRNATIDFASSDGELQSSNRNIGPVPVLKFRHRRPVGERFFVGGEVDGFWAPIRYFNGGSSDVEGAIIDLSLRGGMTMLHGTESYLNLRWVGGGAVGTSSNPEPGSDGFNRNWLHTLSLSVGATIR